MLRSHEAARTIRSRVKPFALCAAGTANVNTALDSRAFKGGASGVCGEALLRGSRRNMPLYFRPVIWPRRESFPILVISIPAMSSMRLESELTGPQADVIGRSSNQNAHADECVHNECDDQPMKTMTKKFTEQETAVKQCWKSCRRMK